MKAIHLAFAALLACAAPAGAQPGGAPDWMAGAWLACEGGEEVSEVWVGAGSGVLIGANVTRGARTSFEQLRVSANAAGGLSYFSSPNGRTPPTEFAMVSHDGARVVFENPAHDFPQRIIYVRTGEGLAARIEGEMEGRAEGMDWRFRRAGLGERCPQP